MHVSSISNYPSYYVSCSASPGLVARSGPSSIDLTRRSFRAGPAACYRVSARPVAGTGRSRTLPSRVANKTS